MAVSPRQQKKDDLCHLLAQTGDPKDIAALLDDLCTLKEIENMAERLFTAKLLIEGNTYNQVMALADISSATLSRVSRCVQHGRGYSLLARVNGKWKMENGKWKMIFHAAGRFSRRFFAKFVDSSALYT